MSAEKAQPRPRATKTPPVMQVRPPVYTQLHAGVDAEVERVKELHRSAHELLGKEGRRSV